MATVPNPTTWSDNTVPASATFNADIKGAQDFFTSPPRAIVQLNGYASAVNATTWTVLTWNADVTDTDNIHDTGTNTSRLTCKTAGRYKVFCNVSYDDQTTSFPDGDRGVAIRKNGNGSFASPGIVCVEHRHCISTQAGSTGTNIGVDGYVSLLVNDYIEAFVYQADNTSDLIRSDPSGFPNSVRFGMIWVSI